MFVNMFWYELLTLQPPDFSAPLCAHRGALRTVQGRLSVDVENDLQLHYYKSVCSDSLFHGVVTGGGQVCSFEAAGVSACLRRDEGRHWRRYRHLSLAHFLLQLVFKSACMSRQVAQTLLCAAICRQKRVKKKRKIDIRIESWEERRVKWTSECRPVSFRKESLVPSSSAFNLPCRK